MFDYIDAGRNPQFFTKDCMEKALSKNEEEKGKVNILLNKNNLLPQAISA